MTGRRDVATSATGGIARLAYTRAKEAGIALPQPLAGSGVAVEQLEDLHARLKVKAQITFLRLVADALGDDLLGFHLACNFDLRDIGLLYYVMASSEVLEDALRSVERYSGIVNEGTRRTSYMLRGVFARYCARAASGHAAAPPRSVMKVRVLFDHLISARHYRWRHDKAERIGGLAVHDHLKFYRQLHREIARFSPRHG